MDLSDGPLSAIARQCFLRFTFAATIHLGGFELLFYVDIKWLLTVKTNRGIGIDIFVGLSTLYISGKGKQRKCSALRSSDLICLPVYSLHNHQ